MTNPRRGGGIEPLPIDKLRWRLPEGTLGFETTADLDPAEKVAGQDDAQDALRFAIDCDARGQNVYVRGEPGTGRRTLVTQLLDGARVRATGRRDRAYVNNFARPDRPRLLSFEPGHARLFAQRLHELQDFIATGLPRTLASEAAKLERDAIQQRVDERVRALTAPLEEALQEDGLMLAPMQQGNLSQLGIFMELQGQPVPLQEAARMVQSGRLPAEVFERMQQNYPAHQRRLRELGQQLAQVYEEGLQQMHDALARMAREVLDVLVARIAARFADERVRAFLDEIVEDVLQTRLRVSSDAPVPDVAARYGVNIVQQCDETHGAPVLDEQNPSVLNLLGAVEPEWSLEGPKSLDYRGIRGGALLRADGGYLILDVMDLMAEPGAWQVLKRVLRSGQLEIMPADPRAAAVYLKPEPIPVDVRVILIGDAAMYYRLDAGDYDFRELFKVLADFDSELPRDAAAAHQYASVIARIANDEQLPAFGRDAIVALIEHGARVAARADKLSARFGRIADLAREAAWLACVAGATRVEGEHVRDAIARTKRRASLPSRRFQEQVDRGTIVLRTRGVEVGQVNGLAVMQAGPLTYGFPARITATIGPGRAGLINIEGQARMSGSIHTKGFHILGGLLRHLLRTDHPLAFSASLAFEQSYGGIDGDSASGAETCCLLSALTGVALRQGMAMTGAIDQHGNVQAIGGVNEKIEGFFDTCVFQGLSGDQGVIIPWANAGDLMLREDVVQACELGRFHIHAVDRIEQALEVFAPDIPAGRWEGQDYQAGSLLWMARQRAQAFWRQTLQPPVGLTQVV